MGEVDLFFCGCVRATLRRMIIRLYSYTVKFQGSKTNSKIPPMHRPIPQISANNFANSIFCLSLLNKRLVKCRYKKLQKKSC